jgi:hypothetical protein
MLMVAPLPNTDHLITSLTLLAALPRSLTQLRFSASSRSIICCIRSIRLSI